VLCPRSKILNQEAHLTLSLCQNSSSQKQSGGVYINSAPLCRHAAIKHKIIAATVTSMKDPKILGTEPTSISTACVCIFCFVSFSHQDYYLVFSHVSMSSQPYQSLQQNKLYNAVRTFKPLYCDDDAPLSSSSSTWRNNHNNNWTCFGRCWYYRSSHR